MLYITYKMGTRDFLDIYARALRPAALGLGHIYQANPSCPCYNYYITFKCLFTTFETLMNVSFDTGLLILLLISSY